MYVYVYIVYVTTVLVNTKVVKREEVVYLESS